MARRPRSTPGARSISNQNSGELNRVRTLRDGTEVSDLAETRTEEELDDEAVDDEILTEARERFDLAMDWESPFMSLYVDDVKFANGDSDNGWQWPNDMWRERGILGKPSLTINKVQTHVSLVTNDAKQNKASIDIRPAGEQSSYDAAQMYEGLVRNIEYRSGAQAIYDDAMESAVEGGIGYWRIITEFSDDDSFDQECRIAPVQSHMGVLLDPNIKQKSGLDAMWGILFDSMPRKEFKRQYPKLRIPSGAALTGDMVDWYKDDQVRIAEYYRIKLEKDELIYVREGDKEEKVRKSQCDASVLRAIRKLEKDPGPDSEVKRRPIDVRRLQWFKIAGNAILDRIDLKTSYIPIVRCVGKERVIDGKLERKGLVRTLKDPQRMYNYNSSGQVEYGALATKSPWVGPAAAFQGNDRAWNNANKTNAAFLTFKHIDAQGQPIPAPTRPEPPGSSPAFITGMQIAAAEFEMASGQGPTQFGKPTVEKSGYAINQTKMAGELITFNFNDNLAIAIETTGIILLDMMPKTYDTKRVLQILDKDGTEMQVQIDPKAPNAYEKRKLDADEVEIIFNPSVGKYKVQAKAGPAYSTQRQEAWNAFVQIVTGNPAFIDEFGDLMFQSADFPLANKISERFKRKIKQAAPWLLDDNAPDPKTQQLTQQLQQATEGLKQLQQALEDKTNELALEGARVSNDYRKTDIQQFDSHTKRIKEVGNAVENLQDAGDQSGLQLLIKQMIKEALGDTAGEDQRLMIPHEQSQEGVDEDQDEDFHEPRRAPDGNHYVKVNGQYHQVQTPELAGQNG